MARDIYGAADELLRYICVDSEVQSTLLLGAPGAGKTTVLREIIRTLSNGERLFRAYQVALADERSELAGMYEGKSSLDVGARTDVMDSCPKAQAMRMLIRSMAPEVLAADELGHARGYSRGGGGADGRNCGHRDDARQKHGGSV